MKNAAPLTESPSGVEAIFLFARSTPLTPQQQARLKNGFDELPKPEKHDLLRGAIWLSQRKAPKLTAEDDRGKLDLTQAQQKNDAVGRLRAFMQGELPRLFADTHAVCYSFKAAK